ncbi:MAG: hypothetical protein ACK4QL_11570 [Pseudanabaenaceae cyanobacterium]
MLYPSQLEPPLLRLLRLHALLRWAILLLLWLSLGSWSIWQLWSDLELWLSYFTWAAVRIALRYQPLPFMGLGICVGATLTVLVWHSTHILVGITPREKRLLLRQLAAMEQWHPQHPLFFLKKLILSPDGKGARK